MQTSKTLTDLKRFKFDGDGYYLKSAREMRQFIHPGSGFGVRQPPDAFADDRRGKQVNKNRKRRKMHRNRRRRETAKRLDGLYPAFQALPLLFRIVLWLLESLDDHS